MPKAAHEALKAEAKKKGLKGDAADRYVYGGLKKLNDNRGSKHGQPTKEPKSRGTSDAEPDADD